MAAPITPRFAVSATFLAFGLLVGLWGGSMPEVAEAAKVDAQTIGSAYLAFAFAGLLAFVISARIGARVSLKHRLLFMLALTIACVFALFHVQSGFGLIGGLFMFAFLSSSVDLVMNSEAVAVERDLETPVLSGFHGLASFGVAGGAIAGSFISAELGLTATAFTALLIGICAFTAIALGTPDRGATQPVGASSSWFRPGLPLVALALIVGASQSGEIASVMFSAKALAEQEPGMIAWSGIGATAYAFFQAIVRMSGDRLRRAFGDATLIRWALLIALTGFLIVSFSPALPVTVAGFAIIGIGTACIVPCGFAMAASLTDRTAAAAISMLLIIGGAVRVPSPYIYGLVAEATGFTKAFIVYAIFVAAALAIAWLALGAPLRRRPA